MRIETAMRLLAKHAEGGKVEQIAPRLRRATVNGKLVNVMKSSVRQGVVMWTVEEGVGEGQTPRTPAEVATIHYRGPSLREGLRVALNKHRAADVDAGGAVVPLVAEVTHGGLGLQPDLHLQINEVVVSTLQDGETLAMAEQFFQTGEGRPLLDWLQERSPEVAAEVERVRRLAAR
jgi:hypothetical protein